MIKLLPINNDPFIRPYTHNMFVDAIINNETTVGNKHAVIRIIENEKRNWIFKSHESYIEYENDVLTVHLDKYFNGDIVSMYRDCYAEDELTIKVDYLQFSSPHTSIYLFVKDFCENKEEKVYLFGKNICYDYFANRNEYDEEMSKIRERIYTGCNLCWYKLKICDGHIKMFISLNGDQWEQKDDYIVDKIKTGKYKIGFDLEIQENQYFNWLFTNFIQLQLPLTVPFEPDYFTQPIKNWKRFTINPFIDFSIENKIILDYHKWSIWDYIKICIDNGKYINLDLDEIFIEGRWHNVNKRSYQHENLIFGYNDLSKEIYLLGSNSGKAEINIVPLTTFQLAYDACSNCERLYLMKYEVDVNMYKLNIKYMIKLLNDYIYGNDSSENMRGLTAPINMAWGIKLYDEFLKEENLDDVASDTAIMYVMHEHKKCMKERLKFLIARKIINKNESIDIINDVDELYNITGIMMIRALKNAYKKIDNITKLFINDLNRIKELEIKAYANLSQKLLNY